MKNENDVFCALMNLEKAYDTTDWHGMLKMLRVYGFRGKVLKAVQRFFVNNRACVWTGMDVSECFRLMLD